MSLSERDNILTGIIGIIYMAVLMFVLGCTSESHTSCEEVKSLRGILGSCQVKVQCASEKEYEEAESEIAELVYKLNAFCQTHKIGRTAVLSATEQEPILNDRDYVVLIYSRYVCAVAGVMFVFEGESCVKMVRLFNAME